jgi:hypothetical protein
LPLGALEDRPFPITSFGNQPEFTQEEDSVSNKNKSAQPATEVRQASNLPHYLEPMRAEFELLSRYLSGDKTVLPQARSAFAAIREDRDNRNNVNAALGKLVVVGGIPISIFNDLLDEKSAKFMSRRAQDFMTCAEKVNTQIADWSKAEAKRVLDLYKAQNAPAKSKDVFAILSYHPNSSQFQSLEAWVYPKPRTDRNVAAAFLDVKKQRLDLEAEVASLEAKLAEAKTRKVAAAGGDDETELAAATADYKRIQSDLTAVREKMAKLASPASTDVDEDEAPVSEPDDEPETVTPTVEDQLASLEAELAGAKTRKVEAAASDAENADEMLAAATADVKRIQAAITALRTTPASMPESDKGVNGRTEFTLDDAIDACTSEGANPDLKRLLERRTGKGKKLTDAEFVKKVAFLTGNANNLAQQATS